MSHMGHNFKVPIRIHERHLQIILRFAKCGPPCEGRRKWIIDYVTLPAKTDFNSVMTIEKKWGISIYMFTHCLVQICMNLAVYQNCVLYILLFWAHRASKLLDYFFRSKKSHMNQHDWVISASLDDQNGFDKWFVPVGYQLPLKATSVGLALQRTPCLETRWEGMTTSFCVAMCVHLD